MAEIKTKVSLYFPKDLFKKFDKLRVENEAKLGVTISKNEFALKLITDAINGTEVESSEQKGSADIRREVLEFFRSDEGKELLKDLIQNMKK
ncbi:hypothetical protein F1737_04330 [Methanoplanus sp. FWC-SCC4]|uniref:Uncharacterized protein n=1 Tax=Methanochimaera problematica TaxID=2609417 RepID=A0AA97FBF2_9EURY|nr:hypothetical protein [Methanoplanus sp. FWC-SCC4]WOF15982.1 hypothetical protein F1737_04330 [Methanoplanus sp. FWC-SCC4]